MSHRGDNEQRSDGLLAAASLFVLGVLALICVGMVVGGVLTW